MATDSSFIYMTHNCFFKVNIFLLSGSCCCQWKYLLILTKRITGTMQVVVQQHTACKVSDQSQHHNIKTKIMNAILILVILIT